VTTKRSNKKKDSALAMASTPSLLVDYDEFLRDLKARIRAAQSGAVSQS
jgi:hypothetical protein